MINSFKTKTAALATIGVLGFGGVAFAATSGGPTTLTGDITDRIATAAEAEVPGAALVGIESRPDGSYAAEVRKSDGTEVGVVLDEDLDVTGTHEGGFRGPGGPGGHGRGGDTATLAKALGVTEAKLESALEAVRETTDPRKADPIAAIAKALGVSSSDIQTVFDARRDGGRRGGGRPDRSALVTALAKKAGTTEDAVTKALDDARTARRDAVANALAEKLGIDAAKVTSALRAVRPAGRP